MSKLQKGQKLKLRIGLNKVKVSIIHLLITISLALIMRSLETRAIPYRVTGGKLNL